MQLTCMEEEGIEILTENFQKKNFIPKISSQIKYTNTLYDRKVGKIWGM